MASNSGAHLPVSDLVSHVEEARLSKQTAHMLSPSHHHHQALVAIRRSPDQSRPWCAIALVQGAQQLPHYLVRRGSSE
jgi:hypothetical protein